MRSLNMIAAVAGHGDDHRIEGTGIRTVTKTNQRNFELFLGLVLNFLALTPRPIMSALPPKADIAGLIR